MRNVLQECVPACLHGNMMRKGFFSFVIPVSLLLIAFLVRRNIMFKKMGFFFILAYLSQIGFLTSSKAADVGGIINTDTTWSSQNSPYNLTSDIQIAYGVTLTIGPDVEVNGNNFQIVVYGNLKANGIDRGNDLTFTDTNIVPGASSSSTEYFSIDIQYATINRGSCYRATGNAVSGNLVLKDSTLYDVSSYMYIWYPVSDCYIERNYFINSGGLSTGTNENIKVYVRNNFFYKQQTDYAVENWASYGTSETVVEYNSFFNTDKIALRLPSGYASAKLSAINNYWYTTDTSVIDSMIFDKNDDLGCAGYITYTPFLTEPHNDTPSIIISPTVTTGSATSVTSNSATLNGTVNANGYTTTKAWFEYGTTSGSYSSTSSSQSVSGWSDTSVSINISGLSSGTTYYYILYAETSTSTGAAGSYGSEASFTTSTAAVTPTPTPTPGTSQTTTPKIAAGGLHTAALKSDGTVWTWGNNSNGQLGDGTKTGMSTPGQVSSLSGVTAIAAGAMHTVSLKQDGTVWTWGNNQYGQLGDGTTSIRTTPMQVSGLSNITAIDAQDGTVVLKSDGTVWVLGQSTVQISGLSGVTAITAGTSHTIALKSDGTVWAWGQNSYGQLGDGTTAYRATPVQVSGLSGIVFIAAGYYHTVAMKSDGTVWTCGWNANGQLGDGTWMNKSTPAQISGLNGVAAIAADGYHTVALKSDGMVLAWGWNGDGQLGDGTTTERTTPVRVSGLSGITAIAAGYRHTLALKSDGTVWACGDNQFGQLGDGTYTNRTTPVQVSGLNLSSTTTATPTPTPSPSPTPTGKGAIFGQVIYAVDDYDASPLNGVVVSIKRGDGGFSDSTTTVSNGEFRFDNLEAGDYTLIFEKEGYSTATTEISLGEGESREVSVILSPTTSSEEKGVIFGVVNDEDDEPLKGVVVSIEREGGGFSDSTKTDDDGYYEFRDIEAGKYTLTFEKEGYQTQTTDVTLEEGESEEADTVTMELIVKGSISGYVYNVRGDPLENVRLKLSGIKTRVKDTASSDADGFFEFTDLEADTYVIFSKKKGYKRGKTTVELEEGADEEIEITLRKTSSRRILVTEE